MFELLKRISRTDDESDRDVLLSEDVDANPDELRTIPDEKFKMSLYDFKKDLERSPERYERRLQHIRDFIEGRGDELIRHGSFPGWTNADLRELLCRAEALNENHDTHSLAA